MNNTYFGPLADVSIRAFLEELIETGVANAGKFERIEDYKDPIDENQTIKQIYAEMIGNISKKVNKNVIDRNVLILAAHDLNDNSSFARLPLELVGEINSLTGEVHKFLFELSAEEKFNKNRQLIGEIFYELGGLAAAQRDYSEFATIHIRSYCIEQEWLISGQCEKLTKSWNQK